MIIALENLSQVLRTLTSNLPLYCNDRTPENNI